MSHILTKKIIRSIESERAERLDKQIPERLDKEKVEEGNLTPKALLGQAVFLLENDIEAQQPLPKKRRFGRLLGRRATQSTSHLLWLPCTDRPDIMVEMGRQVALPVDDTSYEGEHTFEYNWAVEFLLQPRVIDTASCNIYRRVTEKHTGLSEKEIVYKVFAYVEQPDPQAPVYNCILDSFTKGQENDRIITDGSDAATHALALVNLAQLQLT